MSPSSPTRTQTFGWVGSGRLPLLTPMSKGLDNLLAWRWVFAEDPTVIGLKTGRLMSVFRYTCPDTEHLPPVARASYLRRLHEVLAVLDDGWTLDSDWWHEPAP